MNIDATSATNGAVNRMNWYAQGNVGGAYVFGVDNTNQIWQATNGIAPWTVAHVPTTSGHGNGFIVDQKLRLLYAQDRYLGMFDGTTWTDNWQDFGSTYTTTDYRPMDTYEDWVVIGNGSNIAVLNVTDDSFNNVGLNLPDGYKVRAVKSGNTGVLIAINFNNKGALILWDPDSQRSLAPWIWFNNNIQAIVPSSGGYNLNVSYYWYVLTTRGIYQTDGYRLSPVMQSFPDDRRDSSALITASPQGAELIGNYLAFFGGNSFNRQKNGLYMLNLDTSLLEFVPFGTYFNRQSTYGGIGGAIFYDSNFSIQISYSITGYYNYIGKLANSAPQTCFLITDRLGEGDNDKVAKLLQLSLTLDERQYISTPPTFNITLKIATLTRQLFNFAQTNQVCGTHSINVDGTLRPGSNNAQIGDEVTVLSGSGGGQTQHITAITNQGTTTETWTTDNPNNYTIENSQNMVVSPFRKVGTKTFTAATILKDIVFNIKDEFKGRKFLAKIYFDSISGSTPQIESGSFTYDDLSAY